MATGDRNMNLGTIFTGKMDQSFMMATRRLRNIITGLSGQMAGVTKATGKTAAAMNKGTRSVKEHGKAHQWTGRQIAGVEGGLNRIYAAMRVTASYGIAATAIYTVVNAFKSASNIIMDYDQSLKNLQAITNATDAQVALMGKTIEDIASKTKYSVSEIGQGIVVLGQAGFDAGESIDTMGAIAALATGTLSDMRLVTDLLTTVIRSYNLEAIEAERVSDVMASAINNSKLNVDKLRIAFNYVGAIAGQANITLEETAAAMMNLADNGLRASTIGTGLRQIISRLLAPGEKVRDAYASMGVELSKISPIQVGFQQSMKNLAKVLYDSETGTVDMAKAFQLFGLRGAQSAAVIVKSFMSGRFQKALKSVYEVGSAQEMMDKQSEGLALRLKQLSDRFGVLAVAVGQRGAAGALGAVIDMMRDFVEFLTTSVRDGIAGTVLQFTGWSVTIGLTGMALKGLYTLMGWLVLKKFAASLRLVKMTFNGTALAITKTSGALAAFGKVVALTGGPIMWIAVGLGIVVTGFRRFTSATERQIKALKLQGEELLRARSSLDSYRGQIEDISRRWEEGHDVSEEYNAALQRLIKAHPDLAEEMDLTGVSAESLATNIDLLTEASYRKLEARLSTTVNTLQGYTKELANAQRQMSSLELFAMEADVPEESFEKAAKQAAQAKALMMATAAELTFELYELVKAERMTKEEALELVESYVKLNGISEEVGDYIWNNLVKAFNKVETSIGDATDELDDFRRTAEETADAIKKVKGSYDLWSTKETLANKRRVVELRKALLEGTVLEENAAVERAKLALENAQERLAIAKNLADGMRKYAGEEEEGIKARRDALDTLAGAEIEVAEKELALEEAKREAKNKTDEDAKTAQEEIAEAQREAALAVAEAHQALREANDASRRRWIENEGKRKEATKEAQEEIAKTGKTEEELKLEAIEERRKAYAELLDDEVAANEWAAWEIEKLQDKTEDGFEKLGGVIEAWGKDSAQAIADFATGSKVEFKDMVTSMINELIKLMVYQNITKPLFSSIAGAVFSGGDGWLSTIMGMFSGAANKYSGGPTSAGGMYEVNEKGHPELLNVGRRQYLMMGSRDGYVTPLKPESTAGPSGGSPSMEMKVNIINNAGADVKTQQRQGQNGPELDVVLDRMMSKNMVNKGRQSNMALRRNFGMQEMLIAR